MNDRPADQATPPTAPPSATVGRGWLRNINFARPRYTNVVILLGLIAFWAGVLLKLLSR